MSLALFLFAAVAAFGPVALVSVGALAPPPAFAAAGTCSGSSNVGCNPASANLASVVTAQDTSSCESLGDASGFAIFSDGSVDFTTASGSSIVGRIAAAGDVSLDGVNASLGAGESGPEVVAGGSFTGGQPGGSGGTVNGGVSYGQSITLAPNFTVNGGTEHTSPPFSFASDFTSLEQLSSSLSGLSQTSGATVEVNQYSGALELTGTDAVNVFHVTAAQLAQAAGIVINLTQPGATAVIDVDGGPDLSVAAQYMSLSGTATAANVVWNLPMVTSFTVTSGISWSGTILAPNAAVSATAQAQVNGQLIAGSVGPGDWVVNGLASTACIPSGTPSSVVPVVKCVSVNSNGSFVAYFGYTDSGAAVSYPIGPTNSVTPSSLSGGQPVNFVSGTVDDAFSVTVPQSGTAEWLVNGLSATATSSSMVCSDDTLPADPYGMSLVLAIGGGGIVGTVVVRRTARGRRLV
jgi:choice-of-anchor A domain-containing protein